MARSSVTGPASVVNVFVNVSKLEVSESRGSRSMHDVNYNHSLSLFSTNGSLTLVEVPSGLLGAAIEIQKEPRRRRFKSANESELGRLRFAPTCDAITRPDEPEQSA